MRLNVDHLLIQALQEDITSEDVSTNAVMPSYQYGQVQLICKEDGIIAGLEVFERVFYLLDESMEVKFYVKDGDAVKNGQLLAEVSGDVRVLLSGERTALNYLQRMSGIATYTNRVASYLRVQRQNYWIQEKQHQICVYLKNMQCALAVEITIDTIYQMVLC